MEITVNYEYGSDRVGAFPVEELAAFVIASEGKPESTEASISFVDDDEIWRLNKAYRGIDRPTDVLSFECDGVDDDFAFAGAEDAEEPYELGDVVIAVDYAQNQTSLYGTTLEQEVELLVVHGMLHLCGYDHMEEEEAQVMEAREDELLAKWRAR